VDDSEAPPALRIERCRASGIKLLRGDRPAIVLKFDNQAVLPDANGDLKALACIAAISVKHDVVCSFGDRKVEVDQFSLAERGLTGSS
jgi:hypothetical protein